MVKASTGTDIHKAMCARGAKDEPIIIEVEGTINHGNTTSQKGMCNTADNVIEIKEVSNITIVGVGKGAIFDKIGIHIRNSKNIILQNLNVKNVNKSFAPKSNGGDAIGMESDVSNVWVDHCTLEASGGESEGFDAMVDMKATTKYVTVSYCILRNSGRGGLVGSSDSDKDNGPVTFHHNIYNKIDSRTPLLRAATAHCYNNHYDGLAKSGINARLEGQAKVENNYFENAQNPLGTFYTSAGGFWDVKGNVWGSTVVWKPADDETPAGPNPKTTKAISIPYSYSLDGAACVPDILAKTAGANKGLAVTDGKCNKTSIIPAVLNTSSTHSNVANSNVHYNLMGRSMRNAHRTSLQVTTRGLVIDGFKLHDLYSK